MGKFGQLDCGRYRVVVQWSPPIFPRLWSSCKAYDSVTGTFAPMIFVVYVMIFLVYRGRFRRYYRRARWLSLLSVRRNFARKFRLSWCVTVRKLIPVITIDLYFKLVTNWKAQWFHLKKKLPIFYCVRSLIPRDFHGNFAPISFGSLVRADKDKICHIFDT